MAQISDRFRLDQQREEQVRLLQAAIDQGRASGVSEGEPFEYLEELRSGLRAPPGT